MYRETLFEFKKDSICVSGAVNGLIGVQNSHFVHQRSGVTFMTPLLNDTRWDFETHIEPFLSSSTKQFMFKTWRPYTSPTLQRTNYKSDRFSSASPHIQSMEGIYFERAAHHRAR